MKKRVLSALLLISASGGVAYSEEQTPRLSWKGWFAGAHTGGFFGKVSLSGTSIVGATNGDVSGFIGGPIGGYNFRHGNWVFGVEADFGWTNASGTGTASPPSPPPTSPPPTSPPSVSPPPPPTVASTAQYRYDINSIAHLRGRVGHLVNPNLLVYFAGGLAIADINVSEIGNASGWNGHVLSGNYFGWTIGAGVEYALCEWASARLEYLYDDFGSRDFSHGTQHYYNVRAKGHTIRAAINVHFNPEDLF